MDALHRRVLLVCVLATLSTSPGQTFLVSVFHNSLREELHLSATALSGAYTVGTLGSALCMTFVGRFSDRFGPRRMLLLAATGLGLACAWMAGVQGLIGLGIGFFFLRLLGQGSLSLASAHTLTLWFTRRLGFVEGLRNGSISVAVAVAPLVTIFAVERIGWRTTFLLLGGIVWVAVLPAATFLLPERPPADHPSNDPVDTGNGTPGATLSQALRDPGYWAISGTTVASASIITAAHFHKQPLLAEVASLTAPAAAATLVTYAVASLVATLCGGWIADRSLRSPFLLGTALLCAASLLVLFGDTLLACHLAFALYGAAHGLIGVAAGPALARRFGREHFGAIRGSLTTLAVAGTSIGPLTLGLSEDLQGSFRGGIWVFAGVSVPLALLALGLRPRAPQSASPSE